MNRRHLMALTLLGALAGPRAARAADSQIALDRDIPKLLAEHKTPSVSIAQIRGGKVVLTAAYGAQSPGVPATTASLYNIASLTKPLTAEVILRLASKGRLGLD